jgi:hypothetical protein
MSMGKQLIYLLKILLQYLACDHSQWN